MYGYIYPIDLKNYAVKDEKSFFYKFQVCFKQNMQIIRVTIVSSPAIHINFWAFLSVLTWVSLIYVPKNWMDVLGLSLNLPVYLL